MADDLGIEQRVFDRVAAVYRSAYDLELVACRPDGMIVWRGLRSVAADTPTACAERDQAIRESLRWGEPTFSLTTDDRLVWAVPLMRNAAVLGGLVSQVPASSAAQLNLNRAASDLRRMAEHANVTNAALLESHRVAEGRERTRAEAIHALKSAPQYNLRQLYLLEEPLLAAAIRRNDRGAARHILNKLLVGIHATAGDRFDLVKSFYAELVVTVSRTAVWAGGAPRELLQANMAGLGRLSGIGNEEHLAHWLRDMLEQAMDAVHSARRTDDAATLADAVAYLHEHFAEDLTRDEVAKVGCLSPAHFSRQVKRHFGVTFTELVTQLRVDYAAELLARTDKPVGLVALECGFADQSYFTKVFRRAKGLTPRAYRQRADAMQAAERVRG
ncbi:MAG: helix-turn-helix transcriptional regulator [Armatimonadetes bacterium]|nr:helix-turn-helix transcriptional regulator [Armatimonadota bacterium]